MKTLSIEAAAQIRNLREWRDIFDRTTPEENDRYLRFIRGQETLLCKEASEAWFNWTGDEITAALNAENAVLTDGEIEVRERAGRYYFYVAGEQHENDISSDPSITNQERLKAHVESVKAQTRKGKLVLRSSGNIYVGTKHKLLVQGQFTAAELQATAKEAKDGAREDGFIMDGCWQIIGINKDGNRTEASERSGGEFAERLSKKLIDKIFADEPEAASLSLYAESYWLDPELPLVERWRHREPCGAGAEFEILRSES